MNKQFTYELIEKFLKEELKGEELQKFNQQLEKDSELRKAVFMHKSLQDNLGHEGEVRSLEAVLKIANEKIKPAKPLSFGLRIFKYRRGISVAAAVAIMVLSVFFFQRSMNSVEPFELFTEYYVPYQSYHQLRAESNSNSKSELDFGFDAYRNKNYKEASVHFSNVLEANSDNIQAKFYLAICTLSDRQYSDAITEFSYLLALEPHLFIEQSKWYLGLSLLASDQLDQALIQFEDLKAQEGRYSSEAAEIISKLQ